MSRLREGRANTARGAAHFLRETVGRVRYAGARGQLTMRADSGFYAWRGTVAARWMSASPSPSASTRACAISLRRYPRRTGPRSPTGWMAPRCGRPLTLPSRVSPNAAPVRSSGGCSPRPVPSWLFATYSYHGFITDRDGETLELEADHRRHAEIENAIHLKYGVGLNHLPLGALSPPTAPGWRQVMAHNLAPLDGAEAWASRS